MAVTCKNCELAPVVCQISTNGLEVIYCRDCIDEVLAANHRTYEMDPPKPERTDIALLDITEERLQELKDAK